MKVLQVMAGAAQGGAEGFFERLVPALFRAGIDQTAIIRKHPYRGAELTAAGIPTTEVRFGGPLDLISKRQVKQAIDQEKPDLVLAWMNRGADSLPECDTITAGRLGGYYDLKYYRNCDHLIGNTPDLRDYLVKSGVSPERAWYLPNFVDDRIAPPLSRAEFDTPEDVPLLLCLGRLHVNKGFDTALHALVDIPAAHLWIAGSGPEEHALKALANQLKITERVRFLGWRRDMAAMMASADVFVCSSRHEPLGNIVIEAWAHGLPVAACASQGPTQLIEDGRTGLLSAIDDPSGLASQINRLLADPTLGVDLAGEAAAEFKSTYSEGPVVQHYLDFFQRVTGKDPG